MKQNTRWTTKKDAYIINNYRTLPNKVIAANLNLTQNIVRCRAALLRRKGKPVARYPIIYWKRNVKKRETLMEIYGTMPTHKTASIINATVRATHKAAERMNIRFQGNDGCYTIPELAQILKIDKRAIKCWTNLGLRISNFAKDGRTNPRTPKIRRHVKRRFHALIDLRDLRKFFNQRPEAYNLSNLNTETKHLFDLTGLEKMQWKEKKLWCKKCIAHFWTELHNPNAKCPKCKRFAGKWATGYRP